jgi:hypothetical protein
MKKTEKRTTKHTKQEIDYILFEHFKDCHKGETAIFFGSGPSLKQFVNRDDINHVRVGVNETIFLDFLLDYLIVGDAADPKFYDRLQDFHDYKPKKLKLMGRDPRPNLDVIQAVGGVDGSLYYDCKLVPKPARHRPEFAHDLVNDKVSRWGSISFDVVQILAWMGFKNIILVGHDCDYTEGTFHTDRKVAKTLPRIGGEIPLPSDATVGQKLVDHWQQISKFLNVHYPELTVYSFNPRALSCFPEISEQDMWNLR